MKLCKTVILSAALLGAAGVGVALTPVAHGQKATAVAPRGFEVFTAGSGRIGVAVADIEDSDVKASSGVVIESVEADSPAAKAGVKAGDIVVEFDGERVRSVRQFTRLVSETPPGRQVAAAVMRDGQRVALNITTREASVSRFLNDSSRRAVEVLRDFERRVPPAPPRPARPSRPVPTPRPPALETFLWSAGNQLGVTIQTLSDQLAEYFGTKDGVLVTSVTEESAAAKAGVKAGDVIVTVNGDAVDEPADLRREILGAKAGEEFTLGIVRDRKSQTLKGKVESTTNRRRTRTIL